MEVVDDYIEPDLNLENSYNHVALEASLRKIENDSAIPPYIPSHQIDLRSKVHLESFEALRDLIRTPGFELDLHKFPAGKDEQVVYETPYGRTVKKGWQTNHYKVETAKGWLIFDYGVDARIEVKGS